MEKAVQQGSDTTAHDDWTNLRAKIVDVGSTGKLNLSLPVSSHKE